MACDKFSSVVALVDAGGTEYPEKEDLFRPEEAYPEYPFAEVSRRKNEVYRAVRESFHQMGFDAAHYGTKEWNPLAEFIAPGDNVLIKPNLVMDVNGLPGEGTACLYTQPSVVAAVVDYVILALGGKGRITIGDAPMQECNFERLQRESGYDQMIAFYRGKGIAIEFVDFRGLKSFVKGGVHHTIVEDASQTGCIVDLGGASEFSGCTAEQFQRMRVTNYDPRILPQHHNAQKNAYFISNYVLNANVIINMPKPKSHRKAGATIALKNMVGMNVRKEFLPHHTNGAVADGGDEYLQRNLIHRFRSRLFDIRNICQAMERYRVAQVIGLAIRACSLALRWRRGDGYAEGSWYGNHTISKTITDLNKIAFYADRNGVVQETRQRRMLIVADMILCGEGEGPVNPREKPVGMIATGMNPVCFDEVIATLMGFDIARIPTIQNARCFRNDVAHALVARDCQAVIHSNLPEFAGKGYAQIALEQTLHFEPSSGWKGHIELGHEVKQ